MSSAMLLNRFAFVSLLLVSACGAEVQTAVQGDAVAGEQLTGEPVELAQVNEVLAFVAQQSGTALDANKIDLDLVADPFPCARHGQGITCLGETRLAQGRVQMQVAMRDMLTRRPVSDPRTTALCHELWHLVVGDFEHADASVWGDAGTVKDCYRHFFAAR